MRNIALEIAYDGTSYSGWQVQSNAVTIQGVLEDRLRMILKDKVLIKGSGRTDAGVHALGQVASFETDSSMTEKEFKFALNSMLPSDIRIMQVFEVPKNFHPRYSASKRWYRYIISNVEDPVPFFVKYSLWVRKELNLVLLNDYCKRIIGRHDFTNFSIVEKGETPIRNVFDCEVIKKNDFVILDIVANSFLRKMVRTIVGTFLELENLGDNAIKVDEILHAKNRRKAVQAAYPGGLYLIKVFF